MSVFDFNSYKLFLKDVIVKMKRPRLMTDLAKAAGCNRTYLSQVLSGKSNLTADHIVNLATTLSMDEDESDFFLLLLLKDRSVNASAEKKLQERIERARVQRLKYIKRQDPHLKPIRATDSGLLRYQSDWRYAAATFLTFLPHTQTIPSITERLGLSMSETSRLLHELVGMKIIRQQGERYINSGSVLERPSTGPMADLYHKTWRSRVIDRIGRSDGIHISLTLAVSERDAVTLRKNILNFINTNRKMVYDSKPKEETYAYCCDFFRLD